MTRDLDGTDRDDRYVIVSSDAHAGATITGYKAFLASSWHDEFDRWAAAVVNPWHDTSDTTNWNHTDRLAAMDLEGVAGEVLFPNTLPPFFDILAHLSGVPRTRDELDRRWAGLQAHNRWLVEFCGQAPDRRRGLIQLLPNDIDAAIAEMRVAREHPVIGGVMLPAVPPNHTVEPYFHERYDPLWAACVELGFPVHQHQGTGAPDVGLDQDVARSLFFVDLELWTRLTMSHLIVGGVFERHPRLQVVWTEMPGLRWAVEDLERMTRNLGVVQSRFFGTRYNLSHTFGSATADGLSLTPIEYFRRNCLIGASMMPRHEIHLVHVLGTDRIMWGHDFPHEEGSTPYTSDALRATFADFDETECRTLLGETAAALYGFDLSVLTPLAQRIGPSVDLVHTPLTADPPSRGSAFWEPDELALALGSRRGP